MKIYIILVSMLLIFNIYTQQRIVSKRAKRFLYIISIISIALIIGLRDYAVGFDTETNIYIFNIISSMDLKSTIISPPWNLERGYLLFIWIIGQFTKNASIFLLIISFFDLFLVGRWIWINSKTPFLSLIIFTCVFLTFFLTGMRQSIAISIILFAYDDIKSKKLIGFLFKVFIASLFHISALVFLFAYPLAKLKWERIYLLALAIAFPIVYFVRISIFSNILTQIEKYSDFMILDHGAPVTYTLLLILIILSAFIISKGKISDKKELQINFNIVAFAIIIMPLVSVNGSIMRVAMYFSIFICLLLPQIYNLIVDRNLRLIFEMITIALLIILFFYNIINSQTYIYHFINFNNY